jgi:hypothetical protein
VSNKAEIKGFLLIYRLFFHNIEG